MIGHFLPIKNAEAIYITGGNTFLLKKALYEKEVIDVIKEKIMDNILHQIQLLILLLEY